MSINSSAGALRAPPYWPRHRQNRYRSCLVGEQVADHPLRGNVGGIQQATHSAVAAVRIEASAVRTRHNHSVQRTDYVGDIRARTAIACGLHTAAVDIVVGVGSSLTAVRAEGSLLVRTELRRVQHSAHDPVRVFQLGHKESK
jgi:hypothetical protein